MPKLTVDKDNPPNFRVTQRDIAIIEAVYAHRALTTHQIERLLFSPSTRSKCLLRLMYLFRGGYLQRMEQPQVLHEGRKPLVYQLATKGAELLAIHYEIEVSELDWRPGKKAVSPLFLDHLLATNDVRIAVTLALRAHAYELMEWRDDKTLKREHAGETVTIKLPHGGIEQVAIVPDGYFAFETDQHYHRQFLEVDRRTVTGATERVGVHDWARKVRAYLAYYTSERIKERYGTNAGRVLTVTTGDKRATNLKAITEREGGRGRFWFTTFANATPEAILTEPIWRKAGSDELHTLI